MSRDELLPVSGPSLALAPMQDITDLPFWRLIHRYGGPDLYYTEYFRVYETSRLNQRVLRSVVENPTGKPVVAQLIGNHIPALVRTAKELQQYPVAAIDLNLGCPAPVVYRKCAGGGLLRDLDHVDRILGALREAVDIPLTVKTRLGFDSADELGGILEVLNRHALDWVAVHGRSLKQMYRGRADYSRIAQAVRTLDCPVLANGDICSAAQARAVLEQTGARGLMLGRGAVRNPWCFQQIRELISGHSPSIPTGREVLSYIHALYEAVTTPEAREISKVTRIKKHMNYLGAGVDPEGGFLHAIRRARSESGFFGICRDYLDHDRPMPLEPFVEEGVLY